MVKILPSPSELGTETAPPARRIWWSAMERPRPTLTSPRRVVEDGSNSRRRASALSRTREFFRRREHLLKRTGVQIIGPRLFPRGIPTPSSVTLSSTAKKTVTSIAELRAAMPVGSGIYCARQFVLCGVQYRAVIMTHGRSKEPASRRDFAATAVGSRSRGRGHSDSSPHRVRREGASRLIRRPGSFPGR